MNSDLVFLDTECLGLAVDAPIWEIAMIRRGPLGPDDDIIERELRIQIAHTPEPWVSQLPEQFADDYRQRFDRMDAYSRGGAAQVLFSNLAGRPHIVGANPSFDTERIARQLFEPYGIDRPWHYHLIDVENLAVGYLAAHNESLPLPWRSDDLSRAIGVDPDQFDRHTALGDARWVMAQYDTITGRE